MFSTVVSIVGVVVADEDALLPEEEEEVGVALACDDENTLATAASVALVRVNRSG
jgi:hypothetical protein